MGSNTSFPISSGDRAYLHCEEGYQLVGDESVVCFQVYLYRFSVEPSCKRKCKCFISPPQPHCLFHKTFIFNILTIYSDTPALKKRPDVLYTSLFQSHFDPQRVNLEHLKTTLGQKVVKGVESSNSVMSLEVLSVNDVPQDQEPMKIGLDVVNLLIDFSRPLADFQTYLSVDRLWILNLF